MVNERLSTRPTPSIKNVRAKAYASPHSSTAQRTGVSPKIWKVNGPLRYILSPLDQLKRPNRSQAHPHTRKEEKFGTATAHRRRGEIGIGGGWRRGSGTARGGERTP